MRAVFGAVSLLVVLTIVGVLASKQLKASRVAVDPAVEASMPAGTPREQAAQIQKQVVDDVAKAMDAAAARASEADK